MAQYGTVKVNTPSGLISLPVFSAGSSGSDVYEILRVNTPSGVGFIPLADPADAAFPYLRVWTQSYGVLAVHNEASLGPAILWEDDFEDGSAQGFDLDAGFSVTGSNNPISGSYHIYGSVSYDGPASQVQHHPQLSCDSVVTAKIDIRPETATGDYSDGYGISFYVGGGLDTPAVDIKLRGDGWIAYYNYNQGSWNYPRQWSTGNVYTIAVEYDFSVDEWTMYVNGNQEANWSSSSSASEEYYGTSIGWGGDESGDSGEYGVDNYEVWHKRPFY